MATNSKIEWCSHTANIWFGCTKVHAGCDNCYALALSKRLGNDIWGNDKPRRMIKDVWQKLEKYQKDAEKLGEYHRVFVGSMQDIFEKPMPLIDHKGNPLKIAKMDENSYTIYEATKLAKVTYHVSDTFDTEGGAGFGESEDIFSPAGTNIKAGENFMLNTHGFVGYFDGKSEIPYSVEVKHPSTLWGATSLIDTNPSNEVDIFTAERYGALVDNPIMYSKPDYTEFNVEGMDIVCLLYTSDAADE